MLEINKIYNMDCEKGIDLMDYCDVLITDIPYNISKKVHTKTINRRLDYGEWDKQSDEDILRKTFKAISKTKNTCYIFCSDFQFSDIYTKLKQDGWLVRCLVWLKTNPNVLNCNRLYAPSQELIVYAKRRGALYVPKYKKSYFTYSAPRGKKRVHPNQKPLELIKEFILDSSNENDLVCDVFSGSGTTLLAAKNLNRNFLGFELTREYIDITEKRLIEI